MVIAITVAFVVVIHVQCLVSVYLSLVKIKYSVCVWKKKKRNRDTDVENRHVDTVGEWECGTNWEIRINIYTLPCVK